MPEDKVFGSNEIKTDTLATNNGYYTLSSVSANTDTNILFNGESIDSKSKSYCRFNNHITHQYTAQKKHPISKASMVRPKIHKLPLKIKKYSLSSKLDSLCWNGILNYMIISNFNNIGTTEPLLYRLEYHDK
jgi:hypothetical protein